MRKSPLSAPGGSYGRNNKSNYDWNSYSPGYGHQNRSNHQPNEDDIDNKQGNYSTGQNQPSPLNNIGDNFIPLGNSSPVNHRPRFNNSLNNWRGHGSPRRHHRHPPTSPANHPGFNNSYGESFYHNTPRSTFNESNSPQKFHQRQHFGQRRPYQKGAHRNVDISAYLNVRSILEDPWADLMKNLEKSNSFGGNKTESTDLESGDSSGGNIHPADLNVESKSPDIHSDFLEPQIITDRKESETTSTTTSSTTTKITEAS